MIRGTDSEKKSLFSKFFELLSGFTRNERIFILDSIVQYMFRAKSYHLLHFVAEVLAYLKYHQLCEVLNVILKVKRVILMTDLSY